VPPQTLGTLLEELEAAETYGIFLDVIRTAGPLLQDALDPYPQLYTVIAPLDNAFTDDLIAELAAPEAAAQFVLSLLIDKELTFEQLTDPSFTLIGEVEVDQAGRTIGRAPVVDLNRPALNGYIQGVSAIPTITLTPRPQPL
jgi:hypothetical protein